MGFIVTRQRSEADEVRELTLTEYEGKPLMWKGINKPYTVFPDQESAMEAIDRSIEYGIKHKDYRSYLTDVHYKIIETEQEPNV